MTTHGLTKPTVLGLYFNTTGFGYAVFERVHEPLDWQVKKAKDSLDTGFSQQLSELLDRFEPGVIVMRKCVRGEPWPCSKRTRARIRKVTTLAKRRGIAVHTYARADIRQCFSRYGATNKDEIARAIGEIVPDFRHLVPPMRRCWDNEQYVMAVFDAIALIITYYWSEMLDKKYLL